MNAGFFELKSLIPYATPESEQYAFFEWLSEWQCQSGASQEDTGNQAYALLSAGIGIKEVPRAMDSFRRIVVKESSLGRALQRYMLARNMPAHMAVYLLRRDFRL
jgi:hypothetical protein